MGWNGAGYVLDLNIHRNMMIDMQLGHQLPGNWKASQAPRK